MSSEEVKTVFSILERGHRQTMLEQLRNHTPFQMLVMTLLSSRTKDVTTIPIVKKLFTKYPHPQDFIDLNLSELEGMLYGIGFYKVKAKNIKELSRIIIDKYNQQVPDNFEELIALPGVGRKTANCILTYTFNKPAIGVDVHVHRISNRLGWVNSQKPEETENELKKIVPKKLWAEVNKLFVDFGQRLCLPINPKCETCPISKHCKNGKQTFK